MSECQRVGGCLHETISPNWLCCCDDGSCDGQVTRTDTIATLTAERDAALARVAKGEADKTRVTQKLREALAEAEKELRSEELKTYPTYSFDEQAVERNKDRLSTVIFTLRQVLNWEQADE